MADSHDTRIASEFQGDPPKPSRRLFLAAGPSAAVFAALGAAVAAEAAADPIFAAFQEWERLNAIHLAAIAKTDAASGEAYEQQTSHCHAVCEFERKLLATRPMSRVGALAMLLFVADNIGDLAGSDEDGVGAAIRNAVFAIDAEVRA